MNSRQLVLPHLVLSRRIRKTPFEERVFENGATAFTTYNHMPLASYYESAEADYHHLCEFVQVWDVSCERQVEVVGPDALALVELTTPRDISKCEVGQCMYAPLVDEHGGIVNDPIIIKLAEDRYWVSIADSGVLLWLKGIAFGRGMDVSVFEPDVSPLAIQGPLADELMSELLGMDTRKIKFFWFEKVSLADTDLIMARSGWSGQGGFELYLENSSKGLDLWDVIWEAGQKYNIKAGCPNLIDRIERGLFSYGSDMTLANNPYECGLERFVEESKEAECMSSEALQRVSEKGPEKTLGFISIEGDSLLSPRDVWSVLDSENNKVGIVTSLAYSPKYESNLAFASIKAGANVKGNVLYVDVGEEGPRKAIVMSRSWK
jgi:dimethylsulfoniopropionate demethylase